MAISDQSKLRRAKKNNEDCLAHRQGTEFPGEAVETLPQNRLSFPLKELQCNQLLAPTATFCFPRWKEVHQHFSASEDAASAQQVSDSIYANGRGQFFRGSFTRRGTFSEHWVALALLPFSIHCLRTFPVTLRREALSALPNANYVQQSFAG